MAARDSSLAGRCVGILAGGGALPGEVARCVSGKGARVVVVMLEGTSAGDLACFAPTVVGWGQIGRMLATFRDAGVTDLVVVGKVRRPNLWRLWPDWGLIRNLPAIVTLIVRGGGDDGLLRGVIGFFEQRGLRVSGLGEVTPELLAGAGVLGLRAVADAAMADIAIGRRIIGRLGAHDVGQAVVVRDGRIVAIEAAENTDAMLARVAAANAGGVAGEPRGVLIKCCKPGQERRIDLPGFGPTTVAGAAAAGLAGIAVEAGGVVMIERAAAVSEADRRGLFVLGIAAASETACEARSAPAGGWRSLVGGTLSRRMSRDVAVGAGVEAALRNEAAGDAVVVSGGYVLAVAAEEGAAATLARAAGLRQWGTGWLPTSRGVAVVRRDCASAEVVEQAAAARLAGVAVVDGAELDEAALACARRRGIAVLVPAP